MTADEDGELVDAIFGKEVKIAWLAERLSLVGIRVHHDRCNECGSCAWACPVEAASHKVEGRFFAADCYSCARCLTVCPHEAITYGPMFTHLASPEKPASNENAASQE